MRLADARLAASIISHCSMSESFTDRPGVRQWDWMMNTSAPRTDSSKRGRISPLAKSTRLGWDSRLPEMAGDLLGQAQVRAARQQLQLALGNQLHHSPASSSSLRGVKNGPVPAAATTREPGGR